MIPFRHPDSFRLHLERGPKQKPLCMNQLSHVFTTTRVPGEFIDEIVRFAPKLHAVVLRKNQFYYLPLVDETYIHPIPAILIQ